MISSKISMTFTAGSSNSFSVTTTPSSVVPTLSANNVPGGVSFNDNHNGTGTLSGTPTNDDVGIFVITLTETLSGVVTSQMFTLTINSTLPSSIVAYNPWVDFYEYLLQQTSWSAAWKNCVRGDWMLWLLGQLLENPAYIYGVIDIRSSVPPIAPSNPFTASQFTLLSCSLDCAQIAQSLWPSTIINTPTQFPNQLQSYYATNVIVSSRLQLAVDCLTDLINWVNNGQPSYVAPNFNPNFDGDGNLTNVTILSGGVAVGRLYYIQIYGNIVIPPIEPNPVNIDTKAILTISFNDGVITNVNVTSTLYSLVDFTSGYFASFQPVIGCSIFWSAILVYGDLYFTTQYMNSLLNTTVNSSIADTFNAGVFATRALYEAALSAKVQNGSSLGGGAAADAAKALALAARAPYNDLVQAAVNTVNIANTAYISDPNPTTKAAYNAAVTAYNTVASNAKAAYQTARASALAACADIVRNYYPTSPI